MKRRIFSVAHFASWVIAVGFVVSLGSQVVTFGQMLPGAGKPPGIDPRREDRARQIAEGRLRVLDDPAALVLTKRTTPIGVLHRRDPEILVAGVLSAAAAS